MDKLANAIVLTSQGTAFIHAGSEMLRTKNEEHNSYKSPDSINQIDWNLKVTHKDVFKYYQNLIKLRKEHPAFRMTSASDVQKNLEFKRVENGLISYQLKNNANGDSWKKIYVIYNARTQHEKFELEEQWNIAVYNDAFMLDEGPKTVPRSIRIPPISMVVLFQK